MINSSHKQSKMQHIAVVYDLEGRRIFSFHGNNPQLLGTEAHRISTEGLVVTESDQYVYYPGHRIQRVTITIEKFPVD
jgi:hypothetical protein